MTLLGEMNVTSGSVSLQKSVAYSPQEPWIISTTVRDNILFGETMMEKRYREVIDACALDKVNHLQIYNPYRNCFPHR